MNTQTLTKPSLYRVVILLHTNYVIGDINSIVNVLLKVFHFEYADAWNGIDLLREKKELQVSTKYTRDVAETLLAKAYDMLRLDNSRVKCILHKVNN